MTRTSSLIFLPLFIWALCFTWTSAQSTQNIVAIKDFDSEMFLNNRWYEIVRGDTDESAAYACSIHKVERLCLPRCPLYMLMAWNMPTPGAAKVAGTDVIKPVNDGPEGAWYYPNYYDPTSIYIVDRAKNYDWVALLPFNANGAFQLYVLSKTPQNNEARKRGLELAKKYGLIGHEVNQDTKKCDYNALEREASKYY